MKRTLLAVILSAVLGRAADKAAPAPNTLTPEEKRAGWILLFDGATMNGWADPSQYTPPGDAWTIEDGALKAQPKPRYTEDLFTKRTFRDFELAFDWRISPGGNSGVKYRIQDHLWVRRAPGKFELTVEHSFDNRTDARPDRGQDYVIGYEYQLTDDSKNSDALGNHKHTAGALYDMVAPSEPAAKAPGEWNRSRIVLRGAHVEHWMNGVKVVDANLNDPAALEGIRKRWGASPHVYDLMAKQPKKDCPISLQNHGDAAWFRNIKIRPL